MGVAAKEAEIDLAACDHLHLRRPCGVDTANIGKALRPQQVLGDVPGRHADGGDHGVAEPW